MLAEDAQGFNNFPIPTICTMTFGDVFTNNAKKINDGKATVAANYTHVSPAHYNPSSHQTTLSSAFTGTYYNKVAH